MSTTSKENVQMPADDEKVLGKDVLTVSKQQVPVTIKMERVSNLRFYPENPRIYTIVTAGGANPSQDDIFAALREQKHVLQLVKDIREHGGLIDAIIVRTATMEVLEGNSRLAAYRILGENEPTKWGTIKSMMLPRDFSEDMTFSLLNQYHLKGKTKWQPYERAGFVYRRWIRPSPRMSVTELAKDCNEDENEVRIWLDSYKFMLDHNLSPDQWSHAYEYIRSSIISKQRKASADFDEKIVSKIKSGELSNATDIRDKLKDICKNEKILKKFVGDSLTLEDAYSELEDSGSTSAVFNRLKNFNTWLMKADLLEARLKLSKGQEKERLKIELKHLYQRAKRLYERYVSPPKSKGD